MAYCRYCKGTGYCNYEAVNQSGSEGSGKDFCFNCNEGRVLQNQETRRRNAIIEQKAMEQANGQK